MERDDEEMGICFLHWKTIDCFVSWWKKYKNRPLLTSLSTPRIRIERCRRQILPILDKSFSLSLRFHIAQKRNDGSTKRGREIKAKERKKREKIRNQSPNVHARTIPIACCRWLLSVAVATHERTKRRRKGILTSKLVEEEEEGWVFGSCLFTRLYRNLPLFPFKCYWDYFSFFRGAAALNNFEYVVPAW